MNYNGADNLNSMAAMGRYNEWIYDTLRPALGPEILEAGCGNGNITAFLMKTPGLRRYVGLDLSESFCSTLRNRFQSREGLDVRFQAMDLQSPELLALAAQPFDAVACINVLEHIQDDGLILRRFRSLLKPGGTLVLQVPAFQWLYGSIDHVDAHFRRYEKKTLNPLLEREGFRIKKSFYFNAMGIPAWIWHGKVLKHTTHPPAELSLWDRAVPVLRAVENIIHPPVGLSLFVFAENPS